MIEYLEISMVVLFGMLAAFIFINNKYLYDEFKKDRTRLDKIEKTIKDLEKTIEDLSYR